MDRRLLVAAIGLTGLSTLVIASAMLGGISLVAGSAGALPARFPYYVLGGAAVFTGVIIYLERQLDDGTTIITVSIAIAAVGFVGITLGIEGVVFAYREPDRVLSNLLVYLLAAGLLSTGVILWAVRHWREFAATHEIV